MILLTIELLASGALLFGSSLSSRDNGSGYSFKLPLGFSNIGPTIQLHNYFEK